MAKRVVIIGGSGVKDSPHFESAKWEQFDVGAPFGITRTKEDLEKIANKIPIRGVVEYQERDDGVIFIPRHGHITKYAPHLTQYVENGIVAALLGDVVIATSAVGTYHPQRIPVKSLVVPSDYIDGTHGRQYDPYGEGITVHANVRPAFSGSMRKVLLAAATEYSSTFNAVVDGGTYFTMNGPRFGSDAESRMRSQFADLAGMTCNPEIDVLTYLGVPTGLAAIVVDEDTDADHENQTLKIMHDLSKDGMFPDYIEAAVQLAKHVKIPRVDTRIATGIINQGIDRIVNHYARKIAEKLINKYHKN